MPRHTPSAVLVISYQYLFSSSTPNIISVSFRFSFHEGFTCRSSEPSINLVALSAPLSLLPWGTALPNVFNNSSICAFAGVAGCSSSGHAPSRVPPNVRLFCFGDGKSHSSYSRPQWMTLTASQEVVTVTEYIETRSSRGLSGSLPLYRCQSDRSCSTCGLTEPRLVKVISIILAGVKSTLARRRGPFTNLLSRRRRPHYRRGSRHASCVRAGTPEAAASRQGITCRLAVSCWSFPSL